MPVADPTVLHVPATRRFASAFLALALLLLQLAPVLATEITTDLWVYSYGDTVTVTGVDFGPDETVEIVTTDPYAVEVDRGQAQTDTSGGFTYQFVLLSDVPGIYDVVATGLTFGLSAATQFDPLSMTVATLVNPFKFVGGNVVAQISGAGGGDHYIWQRPLGGTFANTGVMFNGSNPADQTIVEPALATGTYELAVGGSSPTTSPTSCANPCGHFGVWGSNQLTFGTGDALSLAGGGAKVNQAASTSGGNRPVIVRLFNPSSVQVGADLLLGTDADGEFSSGTIRTFLASDPNGTWTLTVTSTGSYDANTSFTSSMVVQVETDTQAPDAPVITSPADGSYDNDGNYTVSGTAEANATVKLYDGATLVGTTTALAGSWSVALSGVTDGAHPYTATATDAALNTSGPSNEVTVNVDTQAPSDVIATPSRGPDHNGWYSAPFSVTWSATDPSGITSCSFETYSGPDDATGQLSGTCTDNAGNESAPVTFDFMYDATAPHSVIVTADPTDHNGWYNNPFDAAWSGVDDTSDIDFCTSTTYSGPDDATGQLSGTCTDNAGNSASGTFDFMYDATDPHNVTVAADRTPDSNGWYNHSFMATWSGVDDTSGIDSCTETTYSGPDTASGQLNGTCTDEAGNTSAPPVAFNFMYDATDPSVAVTFPLAGGSYNAFTWNAGCGTAFSGDFCGTGSDALSGLDTVEYSVKRVSNGLYWNGTGFVSSDEVLLTPSGLASWAQSFAYSNFPATDDYTIRAVATDEAANEDDVMVSFTISNPGGPYDFEGFFSPVDNPPAVNEAKAGQGIPVKWRITEAGAPVSDPNSFVALTSRQVTCADLSTLGVDLIEIYAGSSGLQYMGDGYWQFNWKTPKSYAGQCRIMTLTLNDGSTHDAYFRFK